MWGRIIFSAIAELLAKYILRFLHSLNSGALNVDKCEIRTASEFNENK